MELKNDGFMPGAMVAYQSGFVAGEGAAVKLTSPFPSGRVRAVRLLFGGATTAQTVTVTIYEDSAGNDPGAVIYSADVSFTGADNTFQEFDLSANDVRVGSSFRVGLTFQHAGLPSIARDTDGLTPNVNFLQLQMVGWVGAVTFGVQGDWVIRAEVVDAADGGVDAGGVDAGPADAGLTDAGIDAGATVDAGSADAGSDAGGMDAGGTDAGGTDAGGTDAGGTAPQCSANTDCTVGSYCELSTRRCTFDCRADPDCGANMTCSSLGKCVGAAKPPGCGCTSLEWAAASLLLVLAARRRRGR